MFRCPLFYTNQNLKKKTFLSTCGFVEDRQPWQRSQGTKPLIYKKIKDRKIKKGSNAHIDMPRTAINNK